MSDFVTPPPAPPVAPTHISCPNCQYNLTGATIGSACPECGLIIGRGALAIANMPTSGKATASLVLGILSIVGCTFYGVLSIPCGMIAIVLARGVKQQIIREQVSPASAGLARAGMVCGIIGLSLGGLLLLFMIFMVTMAGLH